jgi:sodium/proline symporter
VNALVLYAWGGLGAALGPPLLLAFYWPRMTASGALAGVLVGAGSLIAWEQWRPDGLYELIPAFGAGTLAVVLVSLLGPRPAAAPDARSPRS